MRRALVGLVLVVLASPLAGAAPLARDVAREAGLDFVHGSDHAGGAKASFLEETAGGACAADFDRDGRVDVYVTDFARPRLYRNLAGPNGSARFEDVAAIVGVDVAGLAQGCAWGDYDNDGFPDLFVTFAVADWSAKRDVLYHNLGGHTFFDVTARAGVGGESTSEDGPPCLPEGRCWSTGAAWIDFDLDGDLDLYVAGYAQFPFSTCVSEFDGNPELCAGQANRLYRNEGDGTFVDVAPVAGVAWNADATGGRSLGVVAADLNGDAWPDLYVANDEDSNALYLNAHEGVFRDFADHAGVDNFGPLVTRSPRQRSGMGVAADDFDLDGQVDLVSTHLKAEYDGIYRSRFPVWDDVGSTAESNATAMDASRWGAVFLDADLDGALDLLVVSGGQSHAESGGVHLLLNDGHGQLAEASRRAWPFAESARANHRAAVLGDFDNDGAPDVLVTALPSSDGASAALKLLKFDVPAGKHWLRVSLEGTDSARDAFGASVRVDAEGLAPQSRQAASGGSYLGSNDPRLLFGLGNATRGNVTVTWPGGVTSSEPFDLEGRAGLAVALVEPDLRAPVATAWARASDPENGTLVWSRAIASDFAGYLLHVRSPSGEVSLIPFFDRDARVYELPGTFQARFVRVGVLDQGRHESALTSEVTVPGRMIADPFPAVGLVGFALLAAAFAWRRQRKGVA